MGLDQEETPKEDVLKAVFPCCESEEQWQLAQHRLHELKHREAYFRAQGEAFKLVKIWNSFPVLKSVRLVEVFTFGDLDLLWGDVEYHKGEAPLSQRKQDLLVEKLTDRMLIALSVETLEHWASKRQVMVCERDPSRQIDAAMALVLLPDQWALWQKEVLARVSLSEKSIEKSKGYRL